MNSEWDIGQPDSSSMASESGYSSKDEYNTVKVFGICIKRSYAILYYFWGLFPQKRVL